MAPDQESIPLRIINHVGEQLGFAPTLFLPPIGREPTLRDHHSRLSAYLGFTPFDDSERRSLVRWLRKQVRHDLHRAELKSLAREFLLQRKTLIPADSTLTRIVGSEVTRAEKVSFQKLADIIPASLRLQLDSLLVVEEDSRISKLDWLTQYPPEASPSALLEYMERLDCLREAGMVDVDLREIRPSRGTWPCSADRNGSRPLQIQRVRCLEKGFP